LQPDTLRKFTAMALEYQSLTGKSIPGNSAKRDPAAQAALYAKDPLHAAPPGRSMHEYGYAIDSDTAVVDDLDKRGLLRKYGFWRPLMQPKVKHKESWHIEPIGLNYAKIRKGVAVGSAALLAALAITLAVLFVSRKMKR
jgi:hypothetical protein